MKKSVLMIVVMALLAAISMVSCDSRSKLEEACKEANEKLPMQIAPGLEMTSLELEGDEMVYTYTIDENVMGSGIIDELRSQQSELKSSMLEAMKADSDKEMNEIRKMCREEGIRWIMKFVAQPSGEAMSVTVSPDEL